MKQIELKPEQLKEWARMTDENQHTEVRIEIAKFFKLDWMHAGTGGDFVGAYEADREIQNRYRSVNLPARVIVDNAMFARIAREYGKETAQQVYNCL